MKQKRYLLQENEIPTQWYNIQADMVNKPQPMLSPKTHEPITVEELSKLLSKESARQELNFTDAWIDIPEPVQEMYRYYRSTPLVRAYALEEALGTPAHIYFKNESVSPVGSHKLNSAIPQAYYNAKQGILLQDRGYHQRNHRNRCRAVGYGAFVCSQGFWRGVCRLSSEAELRAKALSSQHYADLWRASNPLAFYVNPCR